MCKRACACVACLHLRVLKRNVKTGRKKRYGKKKKEQPISRGNLCANECIQAIRSTYAERVREGDNKTRIISRLKREKRR